MPAEPGFRLRISQTAIAGQTTDAFAIIGTHANLDKERGRHFLQYIFAYDFARFKPEPIMEIMRKRTFETAEEIDYSAVPLTAFQSSNGLVGARIYDWQNHVAVLGAKALQMKEWPLRDFRKVIAFGGFINNDVIESPGGMGFAEIAERMHRRVVDKLFEIESLDDIRELVRGEGGLQSR